MGIITGGVGFFDSGLGGLNVLDACPFLHSSFPVYYYGDNQNAPYGNKTKEELAPLVFSAFDCFAKLNACAAVVACNTVTALFIDELRARYPFPVVGTEPAVLTAARRGGEVLVLATNATVNSARMRALATRAEKSFLDCTVRLCGCGALAGEIERHVLDEKYDFTPFFPKGRPSSVVLGCTHYAYVKKEIADFYGCEVVDGAEGIANRLLSLLKTLPKPTGKEALSYLPQKPSVFPSFFTDEKRLEKGRKIKKFRWHFPLYFLGSGGLQNLNFHKRMFVFKTNGKKVVKKSQKF
ncbi:MAG: aspartate/glutamate racemase family protein [Clostridia bacterium]|nr:aspartate/glutamate racemase family protein [Clostridia bacterium]